MKTNWSLLQNLVLPAGAVAGTRIVLDGVNGAIQFYDASDQLVIDQESSDSSIAVGSDGGVRLDGLNKGLFIYSGAPAEGNLIGSWAVEAGTDAFGNDFPAGLNVTQGSLRGVGIEAATLIDSIIQNATITDTGVSGSTWDGGSITNTTISIDETSGAILVYASTDTTDTFSTAGNFTWTAPAGVTVARVDVWGAGGGGSGGTSTLGGGGGGGGEYAREFYRAVTPGVDYDVVVGAGGTGGNATSVAGGNGGDSSFDGAQGVYANGGNGSPSRSAGGTGGTGSTSPVHFSGGTGAGTASANGGGGGSSAGTGANGNNSSGTGASAPTGGGAGANGGSGAGSNGSNGSAPGGGGGGAANNNSVTTTTTTYNPVHTYSYYGTGPGGGIRNTDGDMYQGSPTTSLSSFPGDQRSYCLFNYTALHSQVSGATVDKVEVTLQNSHTWFNSGMTVKLGYATHTNLGASTIAGLNGGEAALTSFSIGEGATKTVDVTSVFTAGVLAAMTSLRLGPTSTTSGTYYGYFSTPSTRPQMVVTTHSGVTAPTKGGNGATGKVTVQYTSGQTLIGSWSPVAGTDQYGNAYPAGLNWTDGPAWTAYTPTWQNSAGSPALGNAVVTGRYIQMGKTVHAQLTIVGGTTTNWGTGTIFIGLPVAARAVTPEHVGDGVILDASGGANSRRTIAAELDTTSRVVLVESFAGGVVASTVPWTWANGDAFRLKFSYEAA